MPGWFGFPTTRPDAVTAAVAVAWMRKKGGLKLRWHAARAWNMLVWNGFELLKHCEQIHVSDELERGKYRVILAHTSLGCGSIRFDLWIYRRRGILNCCSTLRDSTGFNGRTCWEKKCRGYRAKKGGGGGVYWVLTCLLKHTCVSFERFTTFCSHRGSCCGPVKITELTN